MSQKRKAEYQLDREHANEQAESGTAREGQGRRRAQRGKGGAEHGGAAQCLGGGFGPGAPPSLEQPPRRAKAEQRGRKAKRLSTFKVDVRLRVHVQGACKGGAQAKRPGDAKMREMTKARTTELSGTALRSTGTGQKNPRHSETHHQGASCFMQLKLTQMVMTSAYM